MNTDGTSRLPVNSKWSPLAVSVISQHKQLADMNGYYSDLLVAAVAAEEEIRRIKGALGFDPNGPQVVPRGFTFIPGGGLLLRTSKIEYIREHPTKPKRFVCHFSSGDEVEFKADWEEIASILREAHNT